MKRGITFLILATVLWGGNYVCGRFLAQAMPSTLLNTVRWAISSMFLIGIIVINKKRLPLLSRWKEFLILGFFGIFAFSTLNYLGLRSISASQAGMISAGIPVAILLFTPVILHEHIKTRAWAGTILSIIGVIVLLLGKHATSTNSSIFGDLEIILSSLAWGMYTVLGKRFGKQLDPLTMTAGAAFYGTLLSLISYTITMQPNMVHMSTNAWLAVLYVSTFASVGAYLLWSAGVNILGASRSAPYINLLPIWTVVLGVVFLHEHISLLSLVGGIITILGAIWASL